MKDKPTVAKLSTDELRKELIDYAKSKGLKSIWLQNEIAYIDEYLKARPVSSNLRKELINFSQQFYSDEETCIANVDKHLASRPDSRKYL